MAIQTINNEDTFLHIRTKINNNDTDLQSQINAIDVSNFVSLSGSQTITGVKTFNALPLLTVDPTVANHAVRKAYLDAQLADKVDKVPGLGLSQESFTNAEKTKLSGIETGAEVNNITDTQATALTGGADTTLHFHASDRNRANHTGTQTASTISDIQTTINNNTNVSQNTANRHAPASVSSSSDISLNITGQQISGALTTTGVTAGSYTNSNVTVDNKGRITNISDGTGGGGGDPEPGDIQSFISSPSGGRIELGTSYTQYDSGVYPTLDSAVGLSPPGFFMDHVSEGVNQHDYPRTQTRFASISPNGLCMIVGELNNIRRSRFVLGEWTSMAFLSPSLQNVSNSSGSTRDRCAFSPNSLRFARTVNATQGVDLLNVSSSGFVSLGSYSVVGTTPGANPRCVGRYDDDNIVVITSGSVLMQFEINHFSNEMTHTQSQNLTTTALCFALKDDWLVYSHTSGNPGTTLYHRNVSGQYVAVNVNNWTNTPLRCPNRDFIDEYLFGIDGNMLQVYKVTSATPTAGAFEQKHNFALENMGSVGQTTQLMRDPNDSNIYYYIIFEDRGPGRQIRRYDTTNDNILLVSSVVVLNNWNHTADFNTMNNEAFSTTYNKNGKFVAFRSFGRTYANLDPEGGNLVLPPTSIEHYSIADWIKL